MPFRNELADLVPGVSRETCTRLDRYAGLLKKWSPAINLVGKGTLNDICTRHIADCAQLFRYRRPGSRHWCDLGSGGGLPGVVIAVLARELAPEMTVSMIESDQRKAAFLQICIQDLALDARVLCRRIESTPGQEADTLSARALAPLVQMMPWIVRHLARGGTALLPKGRGATDEIKVASREWSFDLDLHQSITSVDACILEMRNIRPVAEGPSK